jgi:hypothetical protein
MKLMLSLFAFCLLLQSCKSVRVNEALIIDGKKYNLEMPSDRIKVINLIQQLVTSETDLNPKLVDIKIEKDINLANDEEYFYLLSTDKIKLHKVALLVYHNKTEKSYEVQDKMFIICFESIDCKPSFYDKNWGCDTEDVDNFECKKAMIVVE